MYVVNTSCYQLGRNGLEPIDTTTLQIGQRVRQAHSGEIGTVCEIFKMGYTVIFDDGDSRDSQQVGALSPFTRIEPVEPVEVVPVARVKELIALRAKFKANQHAERVAAEIKHAEDTARLTAEYRKLYPWAKKPEMTKNLKKELSLAFPGVKFSVRRTSYSHVVVEWQAGPRIAEVEAVASKYQDGHFDGMQDIHEHDYSAQGKALDAVLGRVKYLSCYRTWGNDQPYAEAAANAHYEYKHGKLPHSALVSFLRENLALAETAAPLFREMLAELEA